MTIAICSPSVTNKPETFVRSHIDCLKENANVFYYYGDLVPRYIEGEGLFSLDKTNIRITHLIKTALRINIFELKRSKLGIFEYLFAQSLKRHKIDVVLAEYGTTGASILNACKWAQIPLVTHFHGRDCSATDVLDLYAKGYDELFKFCPKIISVSNTMTQKLVDLGCPRNKIVFAPCCPDNRFLELEANLSNKQFVFIGRFTEKKAPYALLFSFKEALKYDTEFKLILAGDGPLLGCCINIAKVLGIEKNVFFPGKINHDEAIDLLKNCRAYVQHSITALDGDMEGTPVAVMEAQAAGVPVISTIHAGIPDVVNNGETGLLCNELDINSMTQNMLTLIQDEELARKMGEKGRERIRSFFSKEWQMDVLTNTLEKAIER